MSSEINRNEDYIYALADGLPWHGLGIQEAKRMTLADIVAKLPRMAETPVLAPLYYRNPVTNGPDKAGNKHAIVFPSDGSYIGLATDGYKPKSYAEAFERAFGWVDSLGAWVSGAALLRGGSRAFIMARVPDLAFTAAGDTHQLWLSVFAGSDGQTGIYPHATFVREVCANTVAAGLAESKKNGRAFSIAHHGNVDTKLAEASVALGQLKEVSSAYQAACEKLAALQMPDKEATDALRELIQGDSSRAENQRDAILRLARLGAGNRPHRGTAYALFQGVTDYVDHQACQSSKGDLNERRFLYATEGAGADLKADALALLLQRVPVAVAA